MALYNKYISFAIIIIIIIINAVNSFLMCDKNVNLTVFGWCTPVHTATMCFVTPVIYHTVTKQTFNSIDVESDRHEDWKMDRAEWPYSCSNIFGNTFCNVRPICWKLSFILHCSRSLTYMNNYLFTDSSGHSCTNIFRPLIAPRLDTS